MQKKLVRNRLLILRIALNRPYTRRYTHGQCIDSLIPTEIIPHRIESPLRTVIFILQTPGLLAGWLLTLAVLVGGNYTNLSRQEVISQYHGLWVVERAFRISKGNLQMRPIFHFTEKRIEAHVCICFVAYKIYKELERQLPKYGIQWSVDKVLAVAKTIPTIKIKMPNGEIISKTMTFTDEQRKILPLIDH